MDVADYMWEGQPDVIRSVGSSTTPLWREEFSVHAGDERYVNRRQFTKFLVLTSFGMFAGNGWILARKCADRRGAVVSAAGRRGAASARSPVGGVQALRLSRRRTTRASWSAGRSGEFAAYSQKCTHLSCAVYYAAEQNRLECPCHEGYFSVDDGRVLQGPPPRPLPRIVARAAGRTSSWPPASISRRRRTS